METNETGSQRHIVKVDRRLCPHCDSSVFIKTFRAHKRLYFDSSTSKWHVRAEHWSDQEFGGSEASDSPPGSVGHTSTVSEEDTSLLVPLVSDRESDEQDTNNEGNCCKILKPSGFDTVPLTICNRQAIFCIHIPVVCTIFHFVQNPIVKKCGLQHQNIFCVTSRTQIPDQLLLAYKAQLAHRRRLFWCSTSLPLSCISERSTMFQIYFHNNY